MNKINAVSEESGERILAIVKKLNPTAKVLRSNYCKVDVKEVIGTGDFAFEKAATGMGWLQSLHELAVRDINGQKKIAPVPETEEYGISSFVYRARRPFNPKRLYKLIHDKFLIMEGVIENEDEEEEGENDDLEEGTSSSHSDDGKASSNDAADDDSDDSWSDVSMTDAEEQGENDDFSKAVDPKVCILLNTSSWR